MTLDKCIVLRIGTLTGCPLCRESHPLCRLKNPTVISIWLLVGFHPATRSVQSTPADNTRKRVWQYIEKERKNSHWSDCYLLSILRNLLGKFEIHMILLSLYYIYLSTILHLSEVSGIFDLFCLYLCRLDPFKVKMSHNLAYTKERKLSR